MKYRTEDAWIGGAVARNNLPHGITVLGKGK